MNESLNRVCPVCGEKQTKPYLTKGDLKLVQCLACTMVFADPVPAEMATGAFYDRVGLEYLSPEKLEGDYSDVRFRRELKLFRKNCRSGLVLDVGCSSGAFLYQLRKRYPADYEICGTDVSGPALDYAEKMGVPVIKGNFLTHDFDRRYDAVTFWAVVEHLFEPLLFLKKAASILKPGGLCFVLVPNMRSLAVMLLGSKYRYIYSEHLNYFTPKTLAGFMRHEFEITDFRSTHFNPLVVYKDFRSNGQEIARAERAQLLKRTNAYKKSPWMLPIKLCYSAGEFVLCKMLMADNLLIVGKKRLVNKDPKSSIASN